MAGHGRGQDQMVPGRSYSFIATLESGASSWTQVLDAFRIGQGDDPTEVTALQLRAVVDRLISAGQHHIGDEPITVVTNVGYETPEAGPWTPSRATEPAPRTELRPRQEKTKRDKTMSQREKRLTSTAG